MYCDIGLAIGSPGCDRQVVVMSGGKSGHGGCECKLVVMGRTGVGKSGKFA